MRFCDCICNVFKYFFRQYRCIQNLIDSENPQIYSLFLNTKSIGNNYARSKLLRYRNNLMMRLEATKLLARVMIVYFNINYQRYHIESYGHIIVYRALVITLLIT